MPQDAFLSFFARIIEKARDVCYNIRVAIFLRGGIDVNAWREILARVPGAEEIFLPFGIDVNKLSDYERLSAFCGVISLCRGHEVEKGFMSALGNMLPEKDFCKFEELSAADVWQEYNRLHGFEIYGESTLERENICPELSVEKYNNMQNYFAFIAL